MKKIFTLNSNSLSDQQNNKPGIFNISQIAHELRQLLTVNTLLIISGPLGVGKTTLIREIIPEARSPSFLHMLLYDGDGSLQFAHIDAYTLRNTSDILLLGLEELLPVKCVIVEWGELVQTELSLYNARQIKIQLDYHENDRTIEIEETF